MIKIAIIGTQGMLGSAVCRYLSGKDYQILEINSSGKTRCSNPVTQFDILNNDINELKKNLKNIDFVINCAGLIKHKINQNNLLSFNNLIRINSLFPIQLTDLSHELNFKVIQVATDCVYSGTKGNYIESDTKDPVDYYGYSKVLGEQSNSNLITFRCSLIGRELNTKIEFLEWVLNHLNGAEINGFSNHLWNGLTTLHFAKIIEAMITENIFTAGTFHLLPHDSVSKFNLIKILLNNFKNNNPILFETESEKPIDRRLGTIYPDFNRSLWGFAGYKEIPSINDMVKEYSDWLE
jgi:dTDP-4-dehydrorhamnose reductase